MSRIKFGDAPGEICPVCRELVGGESELAQKAWDILGRGVKNENEFGDSISVTINISDWREVCELLLRSK
jgi:hypothetical protein